MRTRSFSAMRSAGRCANGREPDSFSRWAGKLGSPCHPRRAATVRSVFAELQLDQIAAQRILYEPATALGAQIELHFDEHVFVEVLSFHVTLQFECLVDLQQMVAVVVQFETRIRAVICRKGFESYNESGLAFFDPALTKVAVDVNHRPGFRKEPAGPNSTQPCNPLTALATRQIHPNVLLRNKASQDLWENLPG